MNWRYVGPPAAPCHGHDMPGERPIPEAAGTTLWLALWLAAGTALSVGAAAPGPAPEALKPMLRIEWREGPEYPMGIQEPAFGILQGKLLSAAGFTRHPKDVLRRFPDAFGGQPSGFTKLSFLFDPGHEAGGWARIADFPGEARQGAVTAVVDGALYAIGGFSYAEPLAYRDVYRLRAREGNWVWEKLPCDLPWPVCETGAAVIGTRIYLACGADYCRGAGAADADFQVEAGRTGAPVGRALLALDTRHIEAGWQRLPDLPGTPRLTPGVAAAGKRLYVLGGTYAPSPYRNTTDNWSYDPGRRAWARLPDLPAGTNRTAVAYRDRYVILLGGYQYGRTRGPDGAEQDIYTPEEKARDWTTFFRKEVLVYDTRTGRVGTADPLLDPTSWPVAAIQGDTVYAMGGEGGARLWHPATFQVGKVAMLSPRARKR